MNETKFMEHFGFLQPILIAYIEHKLDRINDFIFNF